MPWSLYQAYSTPQFDISRLSIVTTGCEVDTGYWLLTTCLPECSHSGVVSLRIKLSPLWTRWRWVFYLIRSIVTIPHLLRERFQKNGNLKWHLPLSFGPLLYNVYMQWGKGMDGKIVPLRGLEAGARGVRSLIANAIITIHFSCWTHPLGKLGDPLLAVSDQSAIL